MNKLTSFNFYHLLFRMMESLKMLDKRFVRNREYGVSLYQRMAGEQANIALSRIFVPYADNIIF